MSLKHPNKKTLHKAHNCTHQNKFEVDVGGTAKLKTKFKGEEGGPKEFY